MYLKGHAGDDLRMQRIGRPDDVVKSPALSAALAVQPDVIRGGAEQATLKARGFLARWLYSIPVSLVGRRSPAPPIPTSIRDAYRNCVLGLWHIQATEGAELVFSVGADQELQNLERWLEPQLAEGEELSCLAGWANKLAGACPASPGYSIWLRVALWMRKSAPWNTVAARRSWGVPTCCRTPRPLSP